MMKLTKAIQFETTFGFYLVDELVGEGGAGRVFAGSADDGTEIALKLLAVDRSSTDKRRRFKNEIAFLSRTHHPNIVPVLDHGVSSNKGFSGPFYVMPRYSGNLRDAIRAEVSSTEVLPIFGKILNGVEAAHMLGVIHRDLKPENILQQSKTGDLAVADFGVAHFTEDTLVTLVETGASVRLANFQYAAPEQRIPGGRTAQSADIYALGLILNELFTGTVPHGTNYLQIADVDERFAFLDPLVARMLAQSPTERPTSIAEVKTWIMRYQADAVSMQKISAINGTIVNREVVDEPLAEVAPRLVGVDWDRGKLTLTLDRPVSAEWVWALHNMGSYSSVMGIPPASFSFKGDTATVATADHEVQAVIDCFKQWLPEATRTLRQQLVMEAQRRRAAMLEELRRERETEEQRLRVNRSIRF